MVLRRFRLIRLAVLGAALALAPLAGLPGSASQAADYHPEWGSISAPSGELLRGCHAYPVNYALTPPSGQWSLEVFITGPQGDSAASLDFIQGANALSGSSTFQLCVPTTHSGTFTINAKLSVDGDGTPSHVEGFLPPSTFTLTKVKRDHGKILTLGPVHVVRGHTHGHPHGHRHGDRRR